MCFFHIESPAIFQASHLILIIFIVIFIISQCHAFPDSNQQRSADKSSLINGKFWTVDYTFKNSPAQPEDLTGLLFNGEPDESKFASIHVVDVRDICDGEQLPDDADLKGSIVVIKNGRTTTNEESQQQCSLSMSEIYTAFASSSAVIIFSSVFERSIHNNVNDEVHSEHSPSIRDEILINPVVIVVTDQTGLSLITHQSLYPHSSLAISKRMMCQKVKKESLNKEEGEEQGEGGNKYFGSSGVYPSGGRRPSRTTSSSTVNSLFSLFTVLPVWDSRIQREDEFYICNHIKSSMRVFIPFGNLKDLDNYRNVLLSKDWLTKTSSSSSVFSTINFDDFFEKNRDNFEASSTLSDFLNTNLFKVEKKTSVLFVSISFLVLMVISAAWLIFYYVHRFRHLHAKDRRERQLCCQAKRALAIMTTSVIEKNGPGSSGDAGHQKTNVETDVGVNCCASSCHGRGQQQRNHKGEDDVEVELIPPPSLGAAASCSESQQDDEEADSCAVCIEPYKERDVVRVLPCNHKFHTVCIDQWILEKRTCPMCKMDIVKYFGSLLKKKNVSKQLRSPSNVSKNISAEQHISRSPPSPIQTSFRTVILRHFRDLFQGTGGGRPSQSPHSTIDVSVQGNNPSSSNGPNNVINDDQHDLQSSSIV